jgi:predicted 3-demethylubiquinone-9 3-methyltransferase (glyoxalase superfamily)
MSSMASRITPCIWFDDQAEAAARWYLHAFGSGRIDAVSHYPPSSDNPSGRPRGSVLTVEFELAGQRLTALNGGPLFHPNPSVSFFVHVDVAGEADRLFWQLADAGEVLMPLGPYPWSQRYGWVQDRFGVSWQVIAGRRPPSGATIVPCLMFSGPQRGRAQDAMRAYTGILPEGRVHSVEPYGATEGPQGAVKHARFVVAGQEMVAMDSHVDSPICFNEGVSLQVACADQAELDRCFAALAEGGQPAPCGWLKDRFGLSWQLVPQVLVEWMTGRDDAARDRVFAALLEMGKLDLAALERAYSGRSGS